jgi:hypothetical protein
MLSNVLPAGFWDQAAAEATLQAALVHATPLNARRMSRASAAATPPSVSGV